jgi:hypothetical protein
MRAFVCDVSVTIPACEPVSEHVHLARVGVRGHLQRVGDQPVGLLAAGAEHDHDAAAGLALGDDPGGGALDALRVGDGGPAELHDNGA